MELNESIIGLTGNEFVFTVEKRHVRQFAQALGDTNPLYLDDEYAKDSRHGGLIAPLTFPIAIGADGEGSIALELDHRRMLHGEQEFVYFRPIRVGDALHCQSKVTGLYERNGKSGKMQFLSIMTEMNDPSGEKVAESIMNIIYRALPEAK